MSELINNSEYRKKKLQQLIKSLHEGKTVDEVKDEFKRDFGEVSTSEISQIEQALVKEGLPVEEVQRLCDVHATVFHGSIADIHASRDYSKVKGHPINVLLEENDAIEKLINEELLVYLEKYLKDRDNNSYLMLRIGFDRLTEVDIHYKRKENLIFPYLEKHSITAPPKVMWGIDDEIRDEIKEVKEMLSSVSIDINVLETKIRAVLKKTSDMVFKENNILVPLLSETFTFYDWVKIDEATPEIGYCLVKPSQSWKLEKKEVTTEDTDKAVLKGEVEFDAGHLLPVEINAIFNTIPIDITFVDANDKVKYFSQAKDRIFVRPKTIIGRDVNMCHPPASVHVVEKIVESFRNGTKDHEDFWIRAKDKFIYIRYFAVRDSEGNFLGTLEVTQDIKPITELEGEKRLLSE